MKKFLLTLLCLCLASGLRAQTFVNLSLQDGLSDHIVRAILKDASGYIWLGTSCSVERFDGCHIVSYLVPGQTEREKMVNALADVPSDGIWFGTYQGLWRIALGATQAERIAPDSINTVVHSLYYHEPTGQLLAGSDVGLYILSPGRLDHLLLEPDVLSPSNTINCITADSLGHAWLATNGGVYDLSLTDRTLQSYIPQGEDMPTSFNEACLLGPTLYLGTEADGIIAMDTTTGQFRHYLDVNWRITALSADPSRGLLHVSSDGGGIQFLRASDGRVVRDIRQTSHRADGLSSNSIYSLLVDREGIIWAGLYQLGLDYSLYQSGLFSTFQLLPEYDLSHMAIRAVEVEDEGVLVGTREGFFYADHRRGIHRHFAPPEIRSQMVLCSHYHQGRYYIGTYAGGMYVLDPQTVRLSDFDPHTENPMVHGSVFAIAFDRNDNLWAATSHGLLCYQTDGRLLHHYNNRNSNLPDENVFCIFFDSRNRGWVCTDTSVRSFTDNGNGITLTDKFPAGFFSQTLVRSIYEDSHHDLYFIPDRGNIFVSDLTLTHFHEITDTPFEGKNVRFVVEDDDHWLWIGTSDGLYRYDRNGHFDAYDFTDGLPSSTFLGCIPRRDKQGRLWIGTSSGLVYTSMEQIDRDWRTGYPLRVTWMQADDDIISTTNKPNERIRLKPVREKLIMHLSQFTYTDPRYMAYEYRLEGKDKDWRTVRGESEVIYYRLPPRTYTFHLRHPGQPDSETTLTFTVRHAIPLYFTIPLSVVLLALVIGAVLYLRRRRRKIALAAETSAAEEAATEEEDEVEVPETETHKYRFSNITPQECETIARQLGTIMREEKLYTNPSLKIGDLAQRLGVPAYKLSYLFNQHLNLSFYDYVNDFRIAEFKELVARGESKSYTIDTLMNRCGFVSRTTFFRYFKKMNGQTPNEYIRSLN